MDKQKLVRAFIWYAYADTLIAGLILNNELHIVTKGKTLDAVKDKLLKYTNSRGYTVSMIIECSDKVELFKACME